MKAEVMTMPDDDFKKVKKSVVVDKAYVVKLKALIVDLAVGDCLEDNIKRYTIMHNTSKRVSKSTGRKYSMRKLSSTRCGIVRVK